MKNQEFTKKLLAGILSSAMFFSTFTVSLLAAYEGQEVEAQIETLAYGEDGLLSAGPHEGGTTVGQPFAAGTGESTNFRIPALLTLQNGWLMAASDARWGTTGDGGGLDTMVSISKDGGETWEYSFPFYFPDSAGYAGNTATTIIDPVLIQDDDGTIYLMADVNPTGVTTMGGYTFPKTGTGFITIDNVERLPLTSNYSNVNTTPSESDTATYEYYVGDFDDNGYAPVISRATKQASEYVVDEWYNLFKLENGSYTALTQTQVNSTAQIQQNVFYSASALHVYNTGYMMQAYSNDNGQTWKNRVLNPQIKHETESALLVSPGRGLLTSDGTVMISFYTWDTTASGTKQQGTFIFSKDNGKTWTRTPDIPYTSNVWSSENEMVELADGTIRMFVRNGLGTVCYMDAVWDEEAQNYQWQGPTLVSTGVGCTSTCNVSAIKYSEKIDGKDAVLVTYPGKGGGVRADGKIYVFLVEEDNTMELAYVFSVNIGTYQYSCLTELDDGTVGLLYENGGARIVYENFDIRKLAEGCIIDNERVLTVPLYGTYREVLDGGFEPEPEPDKESLGIEIIENGGTVANLGADAAFNSETVLLDTAQYTFEKSEDGSYYTVSSQTSEGTTVYLGLRNGKAGYPQNTSAAGQITLEANTEGTFDIVSTSSGYTGRLYFHRDGTCRFNQQKDSATSGETQFKIYCPAEEGEEDSEEIPGYVQVTKAEEIISGGKYLIVAEYAGAHYVLYPSSSESGYYSHVAKVGGVQTLKEIIYSGFKEGKVTFTEAASGVDYTINVVAENLETVPLDKGKERQIVLDGDYNITHSPDETIATAEISKTVQSVSYTGCQGNLGTDNTYAGQAVPLSKALYTVSKNEDGSYIVSAEAADGTEVYLCPRSGGAGYPSATQPDPITFIGNTEGTFDIQARTYGGYLYFWKDGKCRFDQQNIVAEQTKFQLYRPAAEGEDSNQEIPGYVRVKTAAEIVDGGCYLIVSVYNETYYALYPSYSTSSFFEHVIKVNPESEIVTDTIKTAETVLKVTAVSAGVTDVMLDNGVIYRIEVSGQVYTVTLDPAGGTLEGTTFTQMYGMPIEKLPVPIREGYTFDGWYDSKGNEVKEGDVYTVESDSTLTAHWISNYPFVDTPDQWYKDAIHYVYNRKIMTGKDATHFAPGENLARAQFAVILHRMNGAPQMQYTDQFPDVQEGIWYTDAILWAASTGVVTGYTSNGHFGPADNITREQMAVMMYRYAGYKEYDRSQTQEYDGFQDADKVSKFAADAMKWAVASGIITGKDNGTRLDPQGNASRAECAIIIQRFMGKYDE